VSRASSALATWTPADRVLGPVKGGTGLRTVVFSSTSAPFQGRERSVAEVRASLSAGRRTIAALLLSAPVVSFEIAAAGDPFPLTWVSFASSRPCFGELGP